MAMGTTSRPGRRSSWRLLGTMALLGYVLMLLMTLALARAEETTETSALKEEGRPIAKGFEAVLPEEMLPYLREEAQELYEYEWSLPPFRRTRWVSKEQLFGSGGPRTGIELAVKLLASVALKSGELDESRWSGAEYWIQVFSKGGSLDFHFDKDETLWDTEKKMVHPLLASIFYLTDSGGPTLVLDQTYDGTRPRPFVTPVQPDHALFSFPKQNKFVLFNGTKLHGVLPTHSSTRRITLLVNFWDSPPRWPDVEELDAGHLTRGFWGSFERWKAALTRHYRDLFDPEKNHVYRPVGGKGVVLVPLPFSRPAYTLITRWDQLYSESLEEVIAGSLKPGRIEEDPSSFESKLNSKFTVTQVRDVEMDDLWARKEAVKLLFEYADMLFEVLLPRREAVEHQGIYKLLYGPASINATSQTDAVKYANSAGRIKANARRTLADAQREWKASEQQQ